MKILIGLATIAAALSLAALPAAAGGHRDRSENNHSLNRSTTPVIHHRARDLRGGHRGFGRDGRHRGFGQDRRQQYGTFRKRDKHRSGRKHVRRLGRQNHGHPS